MGMTAAEFKTTQSYAKNDLTLYEGKLYRFTANHSAGTWTGNDVQKVDDDEENIITRVVLAADNAEKESDFADTVVFEPSQVEETRYKYILTNAPDPR